MSNVKEGMQKMQCGSCGCDKVVLYTNKGNDLVAQCDACASTTEINISTKIDFDWGENSKGILCVF